MPKDLSLLMTEQQNINTLHIDEMDTIDILNTINPVSYTHLANGETRRRAVSRQGPVDVRMGEPGIRNGMSAHDE